MSSDPADEGGAEKCEGEARHRGVEGSVDAS
eukprot:CAMPEP_0175955470 /NCGR_PEP_ID=MMETSP0108-20121206/32520_1 /TAXON_ID=195067 ORGANISM="Goniomonas pacifica, Strain CCMP1869" /NCGR_SAMPLE_ID=MMETSP0108 /ASSEMBLY_ACC=CAM_ASM_000204 /LENGTH=30 /DNA_ID= /DNA_START= /DNA_END= /DNA_ORIENTATION=